MGKGNTTASGASQVLLSSGGVSVVGDFWNVPELDLKQPDLALEVSLKRLRDNVDVETICMTEHMTEHISYQVSSLLWGKWLRLTKPER